MKIGRNISMLCILCKIRWKKDADSNCAVPTSAERSKAWAWDSNQKSQTRSTAGVLLQPNTAIPGPTVIIRRSKSLERTAGISCLLQMCFNIPDYVYTSFEASVLCWPIWWATHVRDYTTSTYASRTVLFWITELDNSFTKCALAWFHSVSGAVIPLHLEWGSRM